MTARKGQDKSFYKDPIFFFYKKKKKKHSLIIFELSPRFERRYLNFKTSQFMIFNYLFFQKVLILIIRYNFSLNSIKIFKIPMCLFY